MHRTGKASDPENRRAAQDGVFRHPSGSDRADLGRIQPAGTGPIRGRVTIRLQAAIYTKTLKLGKSQYCMSKYHCIAPDVTLGKGVKLSKFINLYGCEIGDETKIGTFVEIQRNAKVGKNCKISSHTFICEGVTIEDEVFIGHGVTFVNDMYPRAATAAGGLQTESDWKV